MPYVACRRNEMMPLKRGNQNNGILNVECQGVREQEQEEEREAQRGANAMLIAYLRDFLPN